MTPEERAAIQRMGDNLDLRRQINERLALIADRLTEITARRDTLLAERDAIDTQLAADLALVKGT